MVSPTAPKPGTRGCVRLLSLHSLELVANAEKNTAPIAQTAERLHGKEKVYGSIPYWGSWEGVVRLRAAWSP